jgi:ATP-dependent exoDNAse (exonuclease V) beta subunit
MLWHRVPANWQPAAQRVLPVPHSLTPAPAEPASMVEFSWVGPLARAAGTAMHVELERLARQGEGALGDLPQRALACESRLREQGIAPDAARTGAQALVARLAGMADEEHARWLLFTAHRGAATEVPLSGTLDGELHNVVIDRMFIDAAGARWIIDYKTGVHGGGAVDEFVARELQRYAPQLRLYSRLAAQLGAEPVRAALYFPWLGMLRELPQASVS